MVVVAATTMLAASPSVAFDQDVPRAPEPRDRERQAEHVDPLARPMNGSNTANSEERQPRSPDASATKPSGSRASRDDDDEDRRVHARTPRTPRAAWRRRRTRTANCATSLHSRRSGWTGCGRGRRERGRARRSAADAVPAGRARHASARCRPMRAPNRIMPTPKVIATPMMPARPGARDPRRRRPHAVAGERAVGESRGPAAWPAKPSSIATLFRPSGELLATG